MSYIIESNIPVPEGTGRGRAKGKLRLTLEIMETGQSIVVKSQPQRVSAQTIANKLNIKIKTRRVEATNTYRVWRIE